MFDIFFGWRKASKCKKLIRRVQSHLKLLKNKRCCIVRQLREDVAQLLKDGYQDVAFKRAEQLVKDESIVTVYELLDHFCEFITIHFPYIRRHKDCPNDINEAISSLIFASARCGDLPELRAIRKLFEERYGQRFAMSAVELYPGNLVNSQVKEKLSINSVSEDMKHRMVDEIARSNSLQQWPLALEYSSELQQQQQQQMKEYEDKKQLQMKEYEDKKKFTSRQCHSYLDSGISTSTSSSSVFLQCFLRKAQKVDSVPQQSQFLFRSDGRIDAAALDQEKEGADGKSSPESSYQLPEEEVVYLDDIEEFQSPTKDSSCQDQRIFMFSSVLVPKGETSEADEYDSLKTEKAVKKRLRKRSMHQKNQTIKAIEIEDYYDDTYPDQGRRSHNQRKQQKGITKNVHHEGVGSNFISGKCRDDRLQSCSRGSHNCESAADCCSLEHPCYCSASDGRNHQDGALSAELQPQKQRKKPEKTQAPYLRATTMPAERAQDNCTDNILRSNSFPLEHPNRLSHVHPKLPDYDDLAAKFTALKKAYLQTKQPTSS